MEKFLLTLQSVTGLGPFIILVSLTLIAFDIKKLYALATTPTDKNKKPDLRFYYILPGLFLFIFGYEIFMA